MKKTTIVASRHICIHLLQYKYTIMGFYSLIVMNYLYVYHSSNHFYISGALFIHTT